MIRSLASPSTPQKRSGDPSNQLFPSSTKYLSGKPTNSVSEAPKVDAHHPFQLFGRNTACPPPIVPQKRKADAFVPVIHAGGRVLYQKTDRTHLITTTRNNVQTNEGENSNNEAQDVPNLIRLDDIDANDLFTESPVIRTPMKRRYRTTSEKRMASAARWNILIPQLVTLYAKLMSMTSHGRHPVPSARSSCTKRDCNGPSGRKLTVTCVYSKCLSTLVSFCVSQY